MTKGVNLARIRNALEDQKLVGFNTIKAGANTIKTGTAATKTGNVKLGVTKLSLKA
jgi:hypothetical protein